MRDRDTHMRSFEIYEYNQELKQFEKPAVGHADGRTAEEACRNFAKDNDWSDQDDNKILWAKPPICR